MKDTNHRKGRRGRPPKAGKTVGREAIIKATEEVLLTTEPVAVTRMMVAQQAGVDPQLIRYYFGTVANLLAEVALNAQNKIREKILETLGVEKPVERLEIRVQDRIKLFLDHPKYQKLVTQILADDQDSKYRKEWAQILKLSLEELTEALAIGDQHNKLRSVDPVFLHMTILGACEFVANNQDTLRQLRGKNTSKKDLATEYFEFFIDLLMNGIKAE